MKEAPPLLCVAPQLIPKFWPSVKPFIESAYLAVDEFMPEDMESSLLAGSRLLWLCLRKNVVLAALVTALEPKPSGKALRCVAIGGTNFEYWQACEARIMEYAAAEGCVKAVLEGRNGWARALSGWRQTRVHLEKTL